jgi:putative transposase
MKQSRYSDEQIVRILREADQGTVAEVAKKNGVSEQTIYAWRKRFGEMTTDDVKRLKALESENARLKKMVAERELAIEVMKEIAAKMYGPTRSCKIPIDADDSLHKCIRPLASGLLLQPGHDEIRARGS